MFNLSYNKKNQLFIYPTETSYAIGCQFDDKMAIERIYHLKKRALDQPLPLIISNWRMFEMISIGVTDKQRKFLYSIWPAPLTIIINSPQHIACGLHSQDQSIAIRMSADENARKIADFFNKPIISTSANLSGQTAALEIASLRKTFGSEVDIYIDGGILKESDPSTIIDLRQEYEFKIRREGQYNLQDVSQ